MTRIDHLVYAAPDLEAGIAAVERLLGIRAAEGGPHPKAGTRNALIALGPEVYLEIIGPDPAQPKPSAPRSFGIDDLRAPKLTTWAAKAQDLAGLRQLALREGFDPGEIVGGSRRRPDGVLLSWQRTASAPDSVIPFLIDWGRTPHPARSTGVSARLIELRAEHPDPDDVRRKLAILGLSLPITRAPRPALVAVLEGPRGRVELR
ncbi:MAG TPA: hypothetical protein DEH78_02840 [Solibacterales bacterium]|nr:hypothetical protein [Bryobacterales bacterium]